MRSDDSKTLKVSETDVAIPADSSTDPIAKTNLIPGMVINSLFKVEDLLGRGGMGSVYRVVNVETNVHYALKCLDKQQTNDATWRRFDLEVRAANKLDHPNLIKVYDSGLLPSGQPFYIMDLVEGETLADVLKRRGRLPLEQVLKIFIQVGFAISYAHENGVIHRDIKPSNIMLEKKIAQQTAESSVKLVDFGIAKLTGKDEFNQQTLTKTGEIFGSPLYMSPEQCLGTGVDRRSDLYSLGCVIYEALTGAPPILGDNALSTMMKHQSDTPISLKEASLGIEFPEQIEAIVAKLLRKDPDSRYQSANLLTEELVNFAKFLTEGASTQSIQRTTTARAAFGVKAISQEPALILMAILIFAAGFAAGCFFTQWQRTQEVRNSVSLQKNEALPFSNAADGLAKSPTKKELDNFAQLAITDNMFSALSKDKKNVVFSFPDFTVGELIVNGKEYLQAKGEKKIPINAEVSFKPSLEFKRYPRLFKRFSSNVLTAIDFASNSKSENVLEDTHVDIDSILPQITKQKRLKILRFDNTSLSDKNLRCLDEFPRLTVLHMNNTKITATELSKLKILGQLKYLKIKGMRNTKPLISQTHKFKAMRELYLQNCDLDKEDLRKLSALKELFSMGASENPKLGDDCMELFPTSLSLLAVDGCNITPASINQFKRFQNLKSLTLSEKSWTDQDLLHLKKMIPGIRVSIE